LKVSAAELPKDGKEGSIQEGQESSSDGEETEEGGKKKKKKIGFHDRKVRSALRYLSCLYFINFKIY